MGQRKPGLMHAPTKIEIEIVKNSHKKACCDCAEPPQDRRLVVTTGSGRRQFQDVRCIECGMAWLLEHGKLVERASDYLATGEGTVRP